MDDAPNDIVTTLYNLNLQAEMYGRRNESSIMQNDIFSILNLPKNTYNPPRRKAFFLRFQQAHKNFGDAAASPEEVYNTKSRSCIIKQCK
jgi:hypothetical protein